MASFAYVFDRRLAKTVIGAATQFLYDGPNIAQQVERQRTTSYLCHRQAGKMTASLVCTSIGRATTLGSDGSSARIGFARLERAPVESEGEPGVRSTAMVGAAVALLATHPVSRAPLEIHVREDLNAAWRERVREVRKEFVGGCDDEQDHGESAQLRDTSQLIVATDRPRGGMRAPGLVSRDRSTVPPRSVRARRAGQTRAGSFISA